MKNVTKVLLLLSIIAIGFSSCSKEKRIEKHLYSKSGKWNNTLYDYKYYEDGALQSSFAYVDAGYIEFEKGGTYSWTFIQDGDATVEAGTWSNTEDMITLISNSIALQFKILEESKTDMKIEYTEIDGSSKEVYTLTLEKDK
ncbi:hypothetical protein [Fluviicola sp.]|uniref:hypothetical protein n=1 Tax=Fluviicola sp. TaxID=1917219 RepID=UPI003D2E4CD2